MEDSRDCFGCEQDPTFRSCCERDALRQALVQKKLEELRKVDRTEIPLAQRRSVIQSNISISTGPCRHHSQLVRHARTEQSCCNQECHTGHPGSGNVAFDVSNDKQAAAAMDWLRKQSQWVIAHFFKKDSSVLNELLRATLVKWCPHAVFRQIHVSKTALARDHFGILSLPSLGVFHDHQLVARSEVSDFIDRNRLMMNELKEFLRPYLECVSGSDDDNETAQSCVICGRDYPHEHIPAPSVKKSETLSSSDEELL